jgi:hypothetical protein
MQSLPEQEMDKMCNDANHPAGSLNNLPAAHLAVYLSWGWPGSGAVSILDSARTQSPMHRDVMNRPHLRTI